MLTKRHLAIIRAALQFFGEEVSPHGAEVARLYFEEPLEEELAIDELRRLRELLQTVELRYVCCDGIGMTVANQELLTSEQALNVERSLNNGRLATVLLTSRS